MKRRTFPLLSSLSIFLIVLAGYALSEPAMGQGEPNREARLSKIKAAQMESGSETSAVVMGRAIISGEVEELAARYKERNPDVSEDVLYWHARKELAVTALIAETAELYATEIEDQHIIRYFKLVYEDEERDIVDNMKERRDEYLVNLYIMGRLGQANLLQGVAPDFADAIRVTPEELRTEYRRYCEYAAEQEPILTLGQFLFPASAFADGDLMSKAVKECSLRLRSLDEMDQTEEGLKELAAKWPGCQFSIKDPKALMNLQKKIADMISEFAKTGRKGDVSMPVELGRVMVIYYILDRQEVEELTFREFQDKHLNSLKRNKEYQAREMIINQLIMGADYYPEDLFFRATDRQAGGYRR